MKDDSYINHKTNLNSITLPDPYYLFYGLCVFLDFAFLLFEKFILTPPIKALLEAIIPGVEL